MAQQRRAVSQAKATLSVIAGEAVAAVGRSLDRWAQRTDG